MWKGHPPAQGVDEFEGAVPLQKPNLRPLAAGGIDAVGEADSWRQPNHRRLASVGVDEVGDAEPHQKRNLRPLAAGWVDEFEGAAPLRKPHPRRPEGHDQEVPAELQNLLLTKAAQRRPDTSKTPLDLKTRWYWMEV